MNIRITKLVALTGLAVAMIARPLPAQTVYWTDDGVPRIQRLDLTGAEDLVTSGIIEPRGIALDVAGGKMYWTDRANQRIQRANFDGTDVQDLAVTGLSAPREVALDPDIPDPACPHDIDDDGAVAVGDLLDLLGKWGPCP